MGTIQLNVIKYIRTLAVRRCLFVGYTIAKKRSKDMKRRHIVETKGDKSLRKVAILQRYSPGFPGICQSAFPVMCLWSRIEMEKSGTSKSEIAMWRINVLLDLRNSLFFINNITITLLLRRPVNARKEYTISLINRSFENVSSIPVVLLSEVFILSQNSTAVFRQVFSTSKKSQMITSASFDL